MAELLTTANHNNHWNPHPQYDSFYRVESGLAPNNDAVWLKILEQTLRYDVQGTDESKQDCLRRLELDSYVFDGKAESQQDLSILHLFVYVSRTKDTVTNNNVHINLGLNPIFNDYTRWPKNNLYIPSNIFKIYVHDTGEKDAQGVPVYKISLYGRVQGNSAVISLQPFNFRALKSLNAATRNYTKPMTSDFTTPREKFDALLKPMSSDFITQAEMEINRDNDLMRDTSHPIYPTAYEQIYKNETGSTVALMPQTTLLTVSPKDDIGWTLSLIKPSEWQNYQGFKLQILTFGKVTFKNIANFGYANSDGAMVLKNKSDTIFPAGTIINLVHYNNYWIQE